MTQHPDNTAFLAVTPAMRKRLSATVEALIALLDEIEGDPDLEETGDDEAWLGWTERGPMNGGSYDDREGEDSDLEPSLGAPERHPEPLRVSRYVRDTDGRQTHWAAGGSDEREDDDCDGEDGHDAEQDPAEGGIADDDALELIEGEFRYPLRYIGDGNREARDMLRKLRGQPPVLRRVLIADEIKVLGGAFVARVVP